jgi:hypothetical protein
MPYSPPNFMDLDSTGGLRRAFSPRILAVKRNRLQREFASGQNLVTLYKALGGGWSEHGPQNAGPAASTEPQPASLAHSN